MESNEDGVEALVHSLGFSPSPSLTENPSHHVSCLLSYLCLALPFPYAGILYFLLSSGPFHPTGKTCFLEASVALRIHTSQLSILVKHLPCLPSVSFVSVSLSP